MSDIYARTRVIEGTTAQWTANNLILGDGEIAVERQAAGVVIRIGDGVTAALSCPIIGRADLPSPAFTGNPTAPTPAPGDNDTSIATTAFVTNAVSTAIAGSGFAPLASPTFTGDPKAPTPPQFDQDTSIATTKFVKDNSFQLSGTYNINGPDETLNVALAGRIIILNSATPVTVTLPAANTLLPGAGYLFFSINTGVFTIQRGGADTIHTGTALSATSFTLNRGEWIHVVSNGGGLWYADKQAAYAPLASPALTGNPTAPTPVVFDNDTSIATTAFVKRTLGGFATVSTISADTTLIASSHAGVFFPLNSANPQVITLPLANTMPAGNAFTFFVTNTGAFTINRVSPDVITTENNLTATSITLQRGDWITLVSNGSATWFADTGNAFAPLASPAFTGNPTAPTPTAGDSDTSIATTAFVTAAVATAGALKADLASPTFTGDPKAPTPAPGDNDTSIATTAFVAAAAALKADLASPLFTGDPRAPTPAPSDNDTSIATTAYVTAAVAAAVGGSVVTPPLFDNDTSIATTAFVRRELGSSAGFIGISADTTLTAAAHANKNIYNGAAVTLNLTLPLANTFPNGGRINFIGLPTAQNTIVSRQGTNTITTATSNGLTAFGVAPGTIVLLESDGSSVWTMVSHFAQQNMYDNGANRVLRVGGFGMGSTAVTPMADANATRVGGMYYGGGTWTGSPWAGNDGRNFGCVLVLPGENASVCTQLFISATYDNVLVRRYVSNAWSAWVGVGTKFGPVLPPLINGYVEMDTFRVTRIGNIGIISGSIAKAASWGNLETICNLSVGYRPAGPVAATITMQYSNFALQTTQVILNTNGNLNTGIVLNVVGTPNSGNGQGWINLTYQCADILPG